jgi:hypothetical protein
MLAAIMMQEIQQLKKDGYSIKQIAEHFKRSGMKVPSKPTLRKYYAMDAAPESPGAKLAKEKAFEREPFKSAIIKALTANPGCYASSVYDLLEELVEGKKGELEMPGNQQTLRNYVRHLAGSGAVPPAEGKRRIYDSVFDTPPAQQALLDFGQQKAGQGTVVHFICLLLRYSRMMAVCAQDHKYDAVEACRAIYRCFRQLGGRPETLVIDQDAVFVASETYGEVVETQAFRDFCMEQGLKLWVCNKADPESKGPIENTVKFVKSNYFSARSIACIEDVWKTLPGWVERKNRRIHQATYRIPAEVFEEIERPALRPAVPSFYESAPASFTPAMVKDSPYILYKTCKYSVPRECCFGTVLYKAVSGRLHVYDSGRRHICTHAISECRGSVNQLPEHKKAPPANWQPVAERLRAKWGCADFQHFINGFKKENPRHLCQQLLAVERTLDADAPPRGLVADVMAECCKLFRYRFSQFHAVYDAMRAGCGGCAPPESMGVCQEGMDTYQRAFDDRCAQAGGR